MANHPQFLARLRAKLSIVGEGGEDGVGLMAFLTHPLVQDIIRFQRDLSINDNHS